jgi:16S rRNA (guanine527-N7)-methyltransferase
VSFRPNTAVEVRWAQQLASGLSTLGLTLPSAGQATLVAYLGLLAKWSRAYNLTAIRDPDLVVARHLLDSLSILPFLVGTRVLDVGTGPGLPGIPLAVARADWSFVLLDSNGKKIRFVRQAKLELALANVEAVQARVERYHCEIGFDCIVSRAFACLAEMVETSAHLLRPGGRWVAMKGPAETLERTALPAGISAAVQCVAVPGLVADRRVVVLHRQ